jgi:hypothetical protein
MQIVSELTLKLLRGRARTLRSAAPFQKDSSTETPNGSGCAAVMYIGGLQQSAAPLRADGESRMPRTERTMSGTTY